MGFLTSDKNVIQVYIMEEEMFKREWDKVIP